MGKSPLRKHRNKALILVEGHQSSKIKRKRKGRIPKTNPSMTVMKLVTSRRSRTCEKLSIFKNRSLKTDVERNMLES